MPSLLDPRRRTAIYVLVAFAAGALLSLGLLRYGPQPSTVRPEPLVVLPSPAHSASSADAAVATSASVASPADAGDSDADADPWPADAPTPEQVFTAQPQMLHDAIGKLAPRTPGHPNVYAVAFGADGSEDVFRNEVEYVDALMARRFGSPGHTLVLENNPASLSTRPLASWTNLEAALDGLAKVMDPREDILLLYVATHGGDDHSLLVDMDPIPLDQLDPEGLAEILGKHAFRWKVLVVNACYSGGFVPKLRGEGTLVLTSARTDRTSFGCGADSDITYFGKAWLADGLNETPDFIQAFGKAKTDIAGWEAKDSLEASEPQIDIGVGIEDKLAAWRKAAKIGPAVPFKAAR